MILITGQNWDTVPAFGQFTCQREPRHGQYDCSYLVVDFSLLVILRPCFITQIAYYVYGLPFLPT